MPEILEFHTVNPPPQPPLIPPPYSLLNLLAYALDDPLLLLQLEENCLVVFPT